MGDMTGISWCDSTFNPWIGCTRISPACDDCYAARSTPARTLGLVWGPHEARRRTAAETWKHPERWDRQHAQFLAVNGRRRRVFCASLADVFDNQVPAAWREDLFELIRTTPNLDWLLLTKRIGNARSLLPSDWGGGYDNVWLGATVVNQGEADRDVPKLLALPASVRFLSIEPMLGPIDLQKSCTLRCPNGDCYTHHSTGHRVVVDSENGGTLVECICSRLNGLSWVIAGGESGPKARPAHPDWFRSLRDQCAAAGVPFHFKQWGEWLPGSQAREVGNQMAFVGSCNRGWQWDEGTHSWRIGKKGAGRLLDGVEHGGFPL
ncbi:phage Gp37/Gp68 family protein [Caldimonas sp. KR1-144]|uniref:phage Gp37/Gp68 family protein n=1 Tax=Caldimonas sp. KR1-144 TaxID=3400911 RepID=UPI003C09BFAA